MTPEQKKQIESMSHEEICKLWRFGDSKNPLVQGYAGEYLFERLKNLGGFTPEISKILGF